MAGKPNDRRPETRSQEPALEKQAPKAAPQRAVPPAPSGEAPAQTKKAPQKPETAQQVTAEERWNRIAEAAYYHAEKRGFVGGDPAQDWAEAEAEIDAQLAARKQGSTCS